MSTLMTQKSSDLLNLPLRFVNVKQNDIFTRVGELRYTSEKKEELFDAEKRANRS